MNRQATLDFYFKNQGKRKCLNLRRKTKRSEMSLLNNNPAATIEISDDEDPDTSLKNTSKSSCSDSSQNTEPYSLNSFCGTPSKQTPIKVSPFSSPSSKPKFYSPSKKRCLSLKGSPSKAKRNISHALKESGKVCKAEGNEFLNNTQGLDDNTINLLMVINKFLSDDSLKPLLHEKSTALLTRSLNVMNPGMRIVCRLYWRQANWYRFDNVKKIAENKSTIDSPTINLVLSSLKENGFLDSTPSSEQQNELSYDDLVSLLKAEELMDVCKSFKLKVHKKDEAKQALKQFCNQKTNITNFLSGVSNSINKNRVLKVLKMKVGSCYKLSEHARRTFKELYILMYLGMDYSIIRDRQLELTLLNEKTNRETYPLPKDFEFDNASVVFDNRKEFECYLSAHDIYEDFLATTETETKCDIVKRVYNLYQAIDKEQMNSYIIKPVWLLRFTPPNIYVKILEDGIQYLKKDKVHENLDLAVKILTSLIDQNYFRQHKKAKWYSEKALIIDKLLLWPDEAASTLLDGFQAGLSEEAVDILVVRAKLLVQRKTNAISAKLKDQLQKYLENKDMIEKNIRANHIYKVPMTSPGRGKIKFETRTEHGVSIQDVEDYCKDYYIREGKYTDGGHWEGRILSTIFFLLFWNIIYKPVKGLRGIFLCHYQVYPLDMFTASFYTNRKDLIEEKIKRIEESPIEDVIDEMETVWKSRPENERSGIERCMSWAQVGGACRCLGARRMARLVARLAGAGGRASGVPDLTVWNDLTGQITFVEVKSDTDKPSVRQLQWMHYMKQHDIDTEFCYVGVNTTRCKARNDMMT